MRRLAWLAGAFSAAVFLAVYLLPEGALPLLAAVCALGSLAGLLWKGDRRRRALLVGFGLAAGLMWSGIYAALALAPARALAGTEGTASAVVAGWPREASFGSSVL